MNWFSTFPENSTWRHYKPGSTGILWEKVPTKPPAFCHPTKKLEYLGQNQLENSQGPMEYSIEADPRVFRPESNWQPPATSQLRLNRDFRARKPWFGPAKSRQMAKPVKAAGLNHPAKQMVVRRHPKAKEGFDWNHSVREEKLGCPLTAAAQPPMLEAKSREPHYRPKEPPARKRHPDSPAKPPKGARFLNWYWHPFPEALMNR